MSLFVLRRSFAGGNTPSSGRTPVTYKIGIQEGYSEQFIQALQKRESLVNSSTFGMHLGQVQAVRSVLRTWPNGTNIIVAFKGGSPELRGQIAEAVKPWTEAGNIKFDFGYDQRTGKYREWSTFDTKYKADVRISFDSQPEPGYWSAVGQDSIKPSLRAPSIASMNFEGFDDDPPAAGELRATVLHEFGHAIGFEHEHQSPNSPCDQEYRWSDDPGYVRTQDIHREFIPDSQGRKPGIYTVLEGPPNNWDKEKIDFNLKQFANSSDWNLTSFDPTSIMKYVFQAWMYRDLAASTSTGCYGPPNLNLSAEDRKAADSAYPRDAAQAKKLLSQQISVSQQFLARKALSPELRGELDSITINLRKAKNQFE
ncbi:MAG: hypothetical protein WBQ89_22605 [Candidatus Acidiferrum sp.]